MNWSECTLLNEDGLDCKPTLLRERVMFIRSPLRNAHRQAPSLAVKPPYTRRGEEGEKREEDTNRPMCTDAPTCALPS